ncbi:MAG: 50S ribosomal protein L23 [Patescibacteria group bacterium]
MITSIVPHLSEKSSLLTSVKQYVFLVSRSATKEEIKSEVEKFFNVEVEKIRIVNLPNKTRVYKRRNGIVKRDKKAIVTLKKGTITLMEGVK